MLCFQRDGSVLFGEDAKNMQAVGDPGAVAFFKRSMGNDAFSVDVLSQLGVGAKENKETDGRKTPVDGLHGRNVSTGQISTGSAPDCFGRTLLQVILHQALSS